MVVVLNIIKAILVRAFLVLHVILCIWRVTENLNNDMYWLLTIILVPFTVEGIFTIVKRQGREFMRFSPCFFLYLCALLPGIWLLELDKSERYIEGTENTLNQMDNDTAKVSIEVPALNPGMWILIIEEFMPYVVIISRWTLPRGSVTREQLSELLFAFIGIAADIMEFFSLFGEEAVRTNKYMGYCVLSIWSWSVMQFTMTITVVDQPKRARKITYIPKHVEEEEEEKSKIRHETFAIFLVMIMQDLPFVILRLYAIITFNIVTYSLIFFTSKNLLIIGLLIYKLLVLWCKPRCPEPEKDEEEVVVIEEGVDDDVDHKKKRSNSRDSLPLATITNTAAAAHVYPNENEPELKKRSGKSPSNGRPSDASEVSSANSYRAPLHDPAQHGNNEKRASPPKSQASNKSAEPSSKVAKASPKAAKDSPKPTKPSPVPSKTSKASEQGNDAALPKNDSEVFGWLNDERVTSVAAEPPRNRDDDDVSQESFKSQSTRSSPLPSIQNRPPSTPPSPGPAPKMSNPPPPKHDPTPSVSSQGSVYHPPKQSAKPGDPDFKPYVSVLKV